MRHRVPRAALLLAALLLPACDGSPSDPGEEPEPQVPSARFSVDSLSLIGPQCQHTAISGIGTGGGNQSLQTFVVQDTTVVYVARGIPFTGGTQGMLGFSVWGRSAGTTRIIGTYHGAADTVVVRVSPPPSGTSITLTKIRPGNPVGGEAPEARSLPLGDTTTVAVGTGWCEPRAMPVGYAVRYESSNPAVVAVEATDLQTFNTGTSWGSMANARLRATGRGVAQVTATAPFTRSATYTVTVP